MSSTTRQPPILIAKEHGKSILSALANEFDYRVPDKLKQRLLRTVSERIPLEPVLRVLDTFIRVSGKTETPLRLGKMVNLEDYGFLGYAIKSSKTIRDALMIDVQFFSTLTDAVTFRLSEANGVACLSVQHRFNDKGLEQHLSEIFLSALYVTLKQLLPKTTPTMVVHLRHPKPDHWHAYNEFPKLIFLFDQPHACAYMSSRLLDEAIQSYDPKLHKLAERQLASLKNNYQSRTLISQRICQLVLSASFDISQIQAAEMLGMSERTLKRRLTKEQTSFKQLIQELRFAKACELLMADSYDINQIARQLGYASSANFCRAFKQWTGMTTKDYKTVAYFG